MCQISRARNDPEAERFWQYVLLSVTVLGHNGMSDEETETRNVASAEGVQVPTRVKVITKIHWRHPYFVELFSYVDRTRSIEQHLFKALGQPLMPRVRVDQVSMRSPPPQIPRSFFKDGYFDGLLDHEVQALKLRKQDIPLFAASFRGHNIGSGPLH